MIQDLKFRSDKGFSLIEMLVTLAILGIVVTIVSLSFGKFNSNQALDKSAILIVSILNEARSRTLSSVGAEQYGVYFGESQVTFFKGSSYSPSDSNNEVSLLHSLVSIRNVTLSGGGGSVIFKRLTGGTDQAGYLEVYLKDEPTTFRTISVNATGVVGEN